MAGVTRSQDVPQTTPQTAPLSGATTATSPATATATTAAVPVPVVVPQPDATANRSFNTLTSAMNRNDFNAFISLGEPAFKAGMSKADFEAASSQIAPRMRKGFESTYLGSMRQKGYQVYLWKYSFNDGGDDYLAQLSMRNGQVGGFFLS
jgi:hypothetical protein